MSLTKADIADRLFEEVGLNKREAKEFVDAFFEAIKSALEGGENVKLSGFGNFQLRDKNQRPGRNPKTGEDKNYAQGWKHMLDPGIDRDLPPIPAKRYFTIGEVSELCGVKPHVLRYWEQEFEQLKPVKRRGNRRYYQRGDVMMIRQIRSLLYEQGYTIGGARQMLEGDEAKEDVNRSQQIIRQVRMELEDVLHVLKR
jgi:integration host factor alpha subunit